MYNGVTVEYKWRTLAIDIIHVTKYNNNNNNNSYSNSNDKLHIQHTLDVLHNDHVIIDQKFALNKTNIYM
jgi:hypothetical protein